MTGDAMRADHEAAKNLAHAWDILPVDGSETQEGMQNLARAYLAQAAEIERRTEKLGLFDAIKAESIERREKLEASEARTADLLKALESIARNSCCEPCREAGRWAQIAIDKHQNGETA